MKENEIVVKARCLITDSKGRALVGKAFDKVKDKTFYSPLGGSLDFGETAEQAIRREMREEVHSDLKNLRLLEVVENLFTFEGKKGHEIEFMYSGDLVREELYGMDSIHVRESTYEFEAEWVDIKELLSDKMPIYPKLDYRKYLTK